MECGDSSAEILLDAQEVEIQFLHMVVPFREEAGNGGNEVVVVGEPVDDEGVECRVQPCSDGLP